MKNNFKKFVTRLVAVMLAAAISAGLLPCTLVYAQDKENPVYPYTIFAGSGDDGAITIKADSFNVNGTETTNTMYHSHRMMAWRSNEGKSAIYFTAHNRISSRDSASCRYTMGFRYPRL